MRIPFLRSPRRRAGTSGYVVRSETKQAILGVLVVALSAIALLSFAHAAGPFGAWLLRALQLLFGWLAYVVPLVGLIGGAYLVWPWGEPVTRTRMIGMWLFAVGLLGIFHSVGVAPEDAYQVALDGKGGGLFGFLLSWPLQAAVASVASLVVFSAALLVGLFLTFNVGITDLRQWLSDIFARSSAVETEDDGESEEADSAAPTLASRFRISSVPMRSQPPDPDQLELKRQQEEAAEQKKRFQSQVKAANRAYRRFSLDLLHPSMGKPDGGDVREYKQKIKDTLENFGIPVTMEKESIGPTVTQYRLRPEQGVKLARITALQNDLALALAAHPIRIEAPIPGTNMVGIEIPNKNVSLVRLRDLLAAKRFKDSESPLSLAVGKDVAGIPIVDTLERMPHLLVAGATGSGKSIFINTLILSLLYRNSPALVRLILVDPKRVELSLYNEIPHLLTPVIVEPEKTINALRWAVKEMDDRYRTLSESGVRNLFSYNSQHPDEPLPFIVIVIDELADLMARHARDVEGAIVRLSQMARAVGIHLVLATQRPSVNVITGLIKANIPARIAFNVASQIDSRTILDMAGAEKLLGSGDMLYLPPDRSKPARIQGGFVSEEEVRRVVTDIKTNNPGEVEYNEDITRRTADGDGGAGDSGDDDLFEDAKRVAIESGKLSASLLQRRLRVGYARAARLLDILEKQGVIGPPDGNKPREVLVGFEEEDSALTETETAPEDPYGEETDSDQAEEEQRW